MKSQLEKSEVFTQLHQKSRCFVVPNPWDLGSLKLLEWIGFQAIASTGAGFAFSKARPDLQTSRSEVMAHLFELASATDLPITTDLQDGYGHTETAVAETITLAASAGVVGGSIEDAFSSDPSAIYPIAEAKARLAAAVDAARSLPFKFMVTARAENYFCGKPDLADTISRLQAYQDAGADVLYAPGIKTLTEIKTIVSAVDRPVNVLMGFSGTTLDIAMLQSIGVRRVSTGGSLARSAYGALIRAGEELLYKGTFSYNESAPSATSFNSIFNGNY